MIRQRLPWSLVTSAQLRAGRFLAAGRFATAFFAGAFLGAVFLAVVFLAGAFLAAVFWPAVFVGAVGGAAEPSGSHARHAVNPAPRASAASSPATLPDRRAVRRSAGGTTWARRRPHPHPPRRR